jgi:stage V sporulation protein R
MTSLLFRVEDTWNEGTLRNVLEAASEVGIKDLGLDIYQNEVVIVNEEGMQDAYNSHGLPHMYPHWSFGKQARQLEKRVKQGQGLAYELVIPTDPCKSWNMASNSSATMALVLAHAAVGHNHFFKNNYLFRQWTDADAILGYLDFAKRFIANCEERHGPAAVEAVLDSAHALMEQGVFRYRRPPRLNTEGMRQRIRDRQDHAERSFRDLDRTLPLRRQERDSEGEDMAERQGALKLPEENLLYFLEKNSPVLEDWQREILRVVRVIAQYFYPQRQTKVMNEGCATFVHYYVMNALYDQDLISEGAMLEVLQNHTNVVMQPGFDDPRSQGLNPYALGFEMMQDIRRICENPTPEDRDWFPRLAGSGDWRGALLDAWGNYRDESFILQFLSPALIRKMRLFVLADDADETQYEVASIHNERGYENVRSVLAGNYDIANRPDIQVVDADMMGDRHLRLHHNVNEGRLLDDDTRDLVLTHIRRLWGYDVSLADIDGETGETLDEWRAGLI